MPLKNHLHSALKPNTNKQISVIQLAPFAIQKNTVLKMLPVCRQHLAEALIATTNRDPKVIRAAPTFENTLDLKSLSRLPVLNTSYRRQIMHKEQRLNNASEIILQVNTCTIYIFQMYGRETKKNMASWFVSSCTSG